MPFVTNVERFGIEKGIQVGRQETLLENIELGLNLNFGEEGIALLPIIRSLQDLDQLRTINRAIMSGTSVAELRALLTPQ